MEIRTEKKSTKEMRMRRWKGRREDLRLWWQTGLKIDFVRKKCSAKDTGKKIGEKESDEYRRKEDIVG